MTRIVFWNVNNRDLTDAVCALAVSTAADVLILNENTVSSSATLHALQRSVSADFYCPTFNSEKRFHCFCRNASLDVSEIHEGFRTSVRKFRLGHQRILLVLVHGLDVRNYDSNKRLLFTAKLADEIKFIKEDKKNNKLVLLGDFNMNPSDDGMNEAEGLNAMMTKACAEKRTRGYLTKDYDLYYNPMWSLFGDNTKGPAGTIYNSKSRQGPYGWSIFDQVILHHSLIPFFQDVEIVTKAGNHSLMDKNGHPDAKNASDHFPIIVDFHGGQQ
ncbi:MAG: endonuclease/exonuclease/phosphatase family protein [Candidatus Electrothrix scaldis]|nr:MAG: endonuclease/exonuclease/phosphatase family protein [Candidatus Electrothrix sp. GW3-3]